MSLVGITMDTPFEKRWAYLLWGYLVVDLARIHQVIPALSSLRPGLLMTVLLMLFLLWNGNLGLVFRFPQIRRIVMFVVLLFVYVPFALGSRAAYGAALGMFLFLPFVFSTVLLITTKDKLIALCKVVVLILLFICCYALLNMGRGPGGGIIDENDLCLFVISVLPLTFFVQAQESKRVLKLLWLLVVIISLGTIVISFSRGGFIGLVVMASVYWWSSTRKVQVLLCAIVLGLGAFYFGGETYQNEMATAIDISDNTARERLLSWQAAWKMFLDRPWGVGGNNFPWHFPSYQSEWFTRNMWGRAAHSLWFTLISETGVVGIALYSSIIYLNFRDIFFVGRHKWEGQEADKKFFDAISRALLASLFGFYAAGTFLSVLYYPVFWYLTTVVVCVRNIHAGVMEGAFA